MGSRARAYSNGMAAFFYPGIVCKRAQSLMTDVSEQLALKLPREPIGVDIEAVRRQPSMTKAIVLCAELAGLVNDKDQARAIGIDATTWSLIKKGERAFDHDKFEMMFDEFGNEVPLLWLADRRGYYLQPKETELQKQLRAEREARLKAEEKLAYLESLHTRALK
jgi:hypothetical protein